jgi:HEAT repeat protein
MKVLRKKKTAIALIVFATAVITALLWCSPSKPNLPDPVFSGKHASAWANQFILDESFEAHEALRSIGEPAVPFLIPNLHRKNSWFNAAYVKLWPLFPATLKSRLEQPILATTARMRGVVALRDMGTNARPAVGALIERLGDKDATVRLHSAIALGNIGPDAKSAVPALKPFLREKHTVRVYTANALWKIERNAQEVLPILEGGVREEQAPFRWAAAVFLGEMGPAAEKAIPALIEAAKAADKETASCAVQALAEISPATVPTLIEKLNDPDPAMRISAATALGKVGSTAKDAIPALTRLLNDNARGMPTIMGREYGYESVSNAAAHAIERIDRGAANITVTK